MMWKIYALLLVTLVIFVTDIGLDTNKDDTIEIPDEYQGPVRPTDDEQHFRKWGITRPLEAKIDG